jgi:AcrR family transcriptional regulator
MGLLLVANFNQMIEIRNVMGEIHAEQKKYGDSKRTVHRAERRRSLVLAAYQLIAEKGFERLRTRDVAARARVNIATLHYYFASKEDLIRGVVDHLLHEFSAAPPPIVGIADTTPFGLIRTMFLATYHRFQAKPELFIVLSELVLRSLRDPSLGMALQRLDDEWHAYLQQMVTNGVSQGIFRAALDPEVMATKLIILIKGFFFHQITSPGAIDFQQLLNGVEHLLLP